MRFLHNSTSGCQINEIEVTGVVESQLTGTSSDKTCDITVGSKTLTGIVTYSNSQTASISSIVPPFAGSSGGDSIHISGANFGSSVSVTIDGIDCAVTGLTATDIYCTTGLRATPPAEGNSFIVESDGNVVILNT